MVAVAVGHHGIFDLRRIEAELFQSADDLVRDRIVPNRIDQDDAFGRYYRPGGIFLLADEIKIVEHLDGFRMKDGWGGRGFIGPASVRPGSRPYAQAVEDVAV